MICLWYTEYAMVLGRKMQMLIKFRIEHLTKTYCRHWTLFKFFVHNINGTIHFLLYESFCFLRRECRYSILQFCKLVGKFPWE